MLKKIVIALGGNALGNTPEEQLELVARTAKPIVDLIEQGNQVVIAHGNGPQVGMINLGMSSAAQANVIRAPMPFPECAAMSQGYIGFHLQNRIGNELAARGLKKEIVTLVTQVLVNEDDPGFSNPTKPIGSFYSREDAKRIEAEKGYRMVEDGGRGYRRGGAPPQPGVWSGRWMSLKKKRWQSLWNQVPSLLRWAEAVYRLSERKGSWRELRRSLTRISHLPNWRN